jgi:hypothetical protein
MRIVLACLVVVSLAGCGVTSRPLTLPSGQHGQAIACPGAVRSMADCYVKAGEVCPAGYDIVDAGSEAHPMVVATSGTLVGGSVVSRSLIVQCH